MKSPVFYLLAFIITLNLNPSTAKAQSEPDIWVSAYIASWNYNVGGHGNWGNTRRSDLKWNSFTHAIFFAQTISGSTCRPNEPAAWENVSPDRINAFVEDANIHDVPAIMSFGGAGNDAFMNCIEDQPEVIADGIADFVEQWRFDGADIDAEPVRDHPNYDVFITRLRDHLPNSILTAAINGASSLFARVHDKFDQINMMTYDLSGAWQGWYSWHNAAIYNPSGGSERVTIPGSSTEYPNIEQWVTRYNEAGVPLNKLGFGIDLYGYVWTGVNAPQQNASGASRRFGETSYDNLVEEFPGIATNSEWDENAQAAWYGTDNQFVSFDNERTIEAKFEYARNKGVGGMIIWEYTGSPNVLMSTVRQQTFGDLPPVPTSPELITPNDDATEVSTSPSLQWNTPEYTNTFEVQVSKSSNFNSLVINENGLETSKIDLSGLEPGTTHHWRVRSRNIAGVSGWSETYSFQTAGIGTSVDDETGLPNSYKLKQNYPNPFNPTTNISFSLPESGTTTLKIYNMLGSEVATLVDSELPAGSYDVSWNASNFSSGVYIYKLTSENFTQTKKLTLIK
ncbi:MAG: glycosyl hydrolase family 18 protein [Gracilimonas sp.]|nr:glycosyl hydrolase family 18 protein [Gracilimonas sp.]